MSLIKKIISFIGLSAFAITAYAADPIDGLLRTKDNPTAGNPNGTISIVEFFDYQCGHCKQMAPVIAKVAKANPNVRIVFKDFPFTGPMADYAARAALAAQKQGKYYPLCRAILDTQAPLTQEAILQYAQNEGLNIKQLQKDMKSPSTTKFLKSVFKLARALGVTGTPTFFIGKTDSKNIKELKIITGEASEAELQEAINSFS